MVLVTFKVRARDDVDYDAFGKVSARMMELVTQMPGFHWIEWYASADDPGTQLALALFESREAVKAWREHPEHREAQNRGKGEFFERYRIQIADLARQYGHPDEPST